LKGNGSTFRTGNRYRHHFLLSEKWGLRGGKEKILLIIYTEKGGTRKQPPGKILEESLVHSVRGGEGGSEVPYKAGERYLKGREKEKVPPS